jgi:hypothetical protein
VSTIPPSLEHGSVALPAFTSHEAPKTTLCVFPIPNDCRRRPSLEFPPFGTDLSMPRLTLARCLCSRTFYCLHPSSIHLCLLHSWTRWQQRVWLAVTEVTHCATMPARECVPKAVQKPLVSAPLLLLTQFHHLQSSSNMWDTPQSQTLWPMAFFQILFGLIAALAFYHLGYSRRYQSNSKVQKWRKRVLKWKIVHR